MKAAMYWISGSVVCVLLCVCIAAAKGGDNGAKPLARASIVPVSPFSSRDAEGKVIVEKLDRSEADWKARLTPEQYHILREKGTERAWSGDFLKLKDVGTYKCAGCGLPLFRSDGKFDSGCGWPSFFEPLEGAHITETEDTTLGMVRTEITCSRCGGHLGHVFHDGPPPTGLRYCVNSVSIEFDRAEGDDGKEPDRDAPADEGK